MREGPVRNRHHAASSAVKTQAPCDDRQVVSRVSVPEKTLEHWSSTHLHNRFPTSALWWPTKGEDIAVDLRRALASRGRPGWALALEVKTARPDKSDVHEVRIRLDQLAGYLAGTKRFAVHNRLVLVVAGTPRTALVLPSANILGVSEA